MNTDRRNAAKASLIGITLMGLVFTAAMLVPFPGLGWVFLFAIPAGAVGAALGLVLQKRYFSFDTRTRTVTARDRWWGTWRTFPREKFERLEYWADSGRLFEVRPDGRRSRVHLHRGRADPADWKAFVDYLDRTGELRPPSGGGPR